MQEQFDVGVSKMKAFRAKRIATNKMTCSFREQYPLLRVYVQELINQNPGTTVRIDLQQKPNPESLTRTFRRVYVCLGALKQVGVNANNGIYPVAYVIVEAESKASWCWFLNLLREGLGIKANFNYTFISDRQKINPCNGWEMWLVVESGTVIIPPIHKPQVGRPSTKRKKSYDEIASQSASSGKLSRKVSSVVNVEMWVITGKAVGVKVVQVKLVVLVMLVQDKLLVQGMYLVKLVQEVKPVQDKLLVQGMPQVKLLVLVNLVQHQAQQAKV
uniref:MULE transposase domain-containing protein n=1 Tax=Tanacetum cinerariifolium TaxID=118510 RepID=A0A6L2LJP5_TANCI|nr:hypothetical protein [Tanacetum cinerariifolium]